MAEDVLNCPKTFDNTGLLFSLFGGDGKLKIWDTSTNILKQEFTKSSHLSSSCSCLIWLHISKLPGHKRKKFKSTHHSGDSLDLIALGTSQGSIEIFDVATNNLLTELEGHLEKVNHLSWLSENNSLFSCSDDKNIIEWDLNTHKIKRKWESGKETVNCILVLSNGKNLLSASFSIKLWDLEKKQVVKVFIGHGTEVTNLIEVPNKNDYFISSARGDRILSVWSLNSADKKCSQTASLLLQDTPVYIQMDNFKNDANTVLYAVTKSGILQVFKHKFNGTSNKPLKPVSNISVMSGNNDSKHGHPIAIQAVFSMQSEKIKIAYGNVVYMYFENIALSEIEQENYVLVRQERRKIHVDEFNSKSKVPVENRDVEYQISNHLQKRGSKKKQEVPLEERLENLALVIQTNETPKKGNMAQLLLQGLQSKDRSILQNVLFRTEQSVIDVTVKHLPIQALVPLIRELTLLMQGKTFTNKCAFKWLQSILQSHSGVLLSNPELTDIFEPLMSLLEARVAVLTPLLKLKGRLDLVVEQVSNKNENTENVAEPLFTYQEESSDEDFDKMSENSVSNSDDVWDEYSEMEDETDDK